MPDFREREKSSESLAKSVVVFFLFVLHLRLDAIYDAADGLKTDGWKCFHWVWYVSTIFVGLCPVSNGAAGSRVSILKTRPQAEPAPQKG